MGEQTEEERVSGMSKHIIDGLRYAYEAYCRGDIEEAVDAIDVDPNILWIEPNEFYAGGTYRGRQGSSITSRSRIPRASRCGMCRKRSWSSETRLRYSYISKPGPRAVVSHERATLPMSIPFMKGRSCRCRRTLIRLRLAKPSDLLTTHARERKWAPSLETERARNQKVANQQAMERRTGAVIHGIKWPPKTAYIPRDAQRDKLKQRRKGSLVL
jgi:hypothetical protein